MIRVMEGSLWGVQAEIWELERKFEMADGKAQAHYHKGLEDPKHDQEALQEELSRMRKRGHQVPLNQQHLLHRPL